MSLLLLFSGSPPPAPPSGASQFGLLPVMLSGTTGGGGGSQFGLLPLMLSGGAAAGTTHALEGVSSSTSGASGNLIVVGQHWAATAYVYENVGPALVHAREGYGYIYENVGGAASTREGYGYIYENVINAIGTGTSAATSSASASLSLEHGLAGESAAAFGTAGREGAVGYVTAELYEDGVLVHSFGEFEVTEETLLELPWTAELLELLSGENVELRLSGDVEIGAVAWRVATSTGPRFTVSGELVAGEEEDLSGLSAAVSAVSGELTVAIDLTGAVAVETTVAAVVGIVVPLMGASSATFGATADLARFVGLTAVVTGVFSTSADLFVAILSGTTHAETTATGDLLMYYAPPPPPPLMLTAARSGVRVGVRY